MSSDALSIAAIRGGGAIKELVKLLSDPVVVICSSAAGATAGAFYTTSPNMALELGVMVFVVVVVGGLGSLEGAMFASLLIGLITSLSVGIDRSLADVFALFGARAWAEGAGGLLTLKLSSVAAAIPFVLMLLVLMVRPSGLMGERT
jgi:branched-chain amino acid transport system permease protein